MSVAHRVKVAFGPGRRLEVVLPVGFPSEGEAEIIVVGEAAALDAGGFSWDDLPVAGGTPMPSDARYGRDELYDDER